LRGPMVKLLAARLRHRFWDALSDVTFRMPSCVDNWVYSRKIRAYYDVKREQAIHSEPKAEA
jgi:hypothetical protein